MPKKNIVLIHGLGTSKDCIEHDLLKLEKYNYNLISLPLPGDPDLKFIAFKELADYTLHIKEQIDELKLEEYSIIGHSFGALIAHDFAYKYQEDKAFNKTVIWAASLNGRNLTQELIYKYANSLPFTKLNYEFLVKTINLLKSIGISVNEIDMKSLANTDKRFVENGLRIIEEYQPSFESLTKKRLFLFGTKDIYVPLENYKLAKLRFSKDENTEVVLLKNGGHYGNEKALDNVVTKIEEFLSN